MRVATDLFELELGIEAWCVQFPQGMDANEYALQRDHAESALNLALQQAQWMGLGVAPSVVFRHELGDEASAQPSSLAVQGSLPAASTAPIAGEHTSNGELQLRCGARVWRVRGWQKNRVSEVMKVNVQVRDETSGLFHA